MIEMMRVQNYTVVDVEQATAEKWMEFTMSVTGSSVLGSVKNNYNTNQKGEKGYIHTFYPDILYEQKLTECQRDNWTGFVFKQ